MNCSIAKARAKVYTVANKEMVFAYWNVGREIVEKQGGAERAKYGDGLIRGLSLKLTAEFGPGYTSTNLKYMRLVFLAFPIGHTLCDQLSWSHYRTLAGVENERARQFYFGKCAKSGWSVRDLQRKISTLFYERLIANRAGEEVYHRDLVFYNFLACCFFLVDLKVGKITPEDIGQIQLYKHYYERERMNPGNNPPGGIDHDVLRV